MDPLIIGAAWEEPICFMASKTLFNNKLLNWFFNQVCVSPIERQNKNNVDSVKIIYNLVKEHKNVFIFPEGTRTNDGNFKNAKLGISLLASNLKCPVVPMYISGTYKIWNRHHKLPKPFGKITCIVGEPLYYQNSDTNSSKKEQQVAFAKEVMKKIEDLKTIHNSKCI